MTNEDLMKEAAARLREAGVEGPAEEAELLLAHALRTTRERVFAHPETEVPAAAVRRYRALITRRARHVPYAYLVGFKEFYGRRFFVSEDVLIPRPETEVLVEAVLSSLSSRAKRSAAEGSLSVLDVGTGSGAVGLTLAAEIPASQVIAIDVSVKALRVARLNAKRLGVEKRVKFKKLDILRPNGSLGFARDDREGRPMAVVANLPYLLKTTWAAAAPEVRRHEPKLALVSGHDGLDHYRALLRRLRSWKIDPAPLALEAEPDQMPELRRLVREAFPRLRGRVLKDLHGDERVLLAE